MKNVGEADPNCGQVIRSFRQHEVCEQGFSTDDLVISLMKIMVESESSGERQCSTFAATVHTEGELQKQCNTLLCEKKEAERKAANAVNEKKQAIESKERATALLAKGGANKGGGKHGRDRGGKSSNNNRDANNDGSDQGGWTEKYCNNCAKYYRSINKEESKWRAIHSHNTNECVHAGAGAGNRPPADGVKKDGAKKKKDKGKGKGKGKGGKGKRW